MPENLSQVEVESLDLNVFEFYLIGTMQSNIVPIKSMKLMCCREFTVWLLLIFNFSLVALYMNSVIKIYSFHYHKTTRHYVEVQLNTHKKP